MASSGSSSVFAGFRFPREVIAVAVRWYLRYGLSYRDVEELLAVYRWVQRFTPEFIEAAMGATRSWRAISSPPTCPAAPRPTSSP
jgi:transposase-like protein